MFVESIRKAWKKRAIRNQIQKAGEKDWRTFSKALCNSSNTCQGFPIECKCCFDSYYKATINMKGSRKQVFLKE